MKQVKLTRRDKIRLSEKFGRDGWRKFAGKELAKVVLELRAETGKSLNDTRRVHGR